MMKHVVDLSGNKQLINMNNVTHIEKLSNYYTVYFVNGSRLDIKPFDFS